ncbi:hypothetical protein JCM10049v2_004688 [Rhodotorula toruloides]
MGLGNWAREEWAEAKEAGSEIVRFVRTHNWKQTARNSVKRKYWLWWLAGAAGIAAVVLLAIYRDTIVEKFEPHKEDIVKLPVSWLIPVAILVILSFPPLGGHEIVLLVVGLIWGVWIGFAIACAGTFIGEVLCFFAFKYFLTGHAAKIEQKSIFYACIARLMRHGGLWIIIVVRFSAVPGHVVTAVQSTVGMSIWYYSIAIIVSLPKQLAVVYLGYLFGLNKQTTDPANVHKQRVISLSVFFGTAVATVLALYIVYMRARRYYPEVLRDMEKSSLATNPFDPESSHESVPALHRRSSLAEAAFDGDAGLAYIAPQNRDEKAMGMVRTESGRWRTVEEEDEDEDDGGAWSAKSPAVRGDAAWQDGRTAGDEGLDSVPRLGYNAQQQQGRYGHLPLRGASEDQYGPPPSEGGIAYQPPSDAQERYWPGQRQGGGHYGATGASR